MCQGVLPTMPAKMDRYSDCDSGYVEGDEYTVVDCTGRCREQVEYLGIPDPLIDFADCAIQNTFHKTYTPAFKPFMVELIRRVRCTPTALIMALIYLERLSTAIGPTKADNCANRLFLTAIILAVKYVSDDVYKNRDFAHMTGVEISKINAMEREFLRFVDYRLYVSDDEYAAFLSYIDACLFPAGAEPAEMPSKTSLHKFAPMIPAYYLPTPKPSYGAVNRASYGSGVQQQVYFVQPAVYAPAPHMDFNAYIVY
eukprot:Opistho-1_new@81024